MLAKLWRASRAKASSGALTLAELLIRFGDWIRPEDGGPRPTTPK